MDTPPLNNCLHCGGAAKFMDTSAGFPCNPMVYCVDCGSNIVRYYDHGAGYAAARAAVIEAWNRKYT